MNPDAKIADTGEKMEAYYDKDLKRWIFPGDDPAEVAKPLAPPPIIPAKKTTEENGVGMQTPSKPNVNNDPLSFLMAPPSRTPGSAIEKGGDPIANLMAPPRGGLPRSSHYSEPRVRSTSSRVASMNIPASARKPPGASDGKKSAPSYVIFQPPPTPLGTEEKEE